MSASLSKLSKITCASEAKDVCCLVDRILSQASHESGPMREAIERIKPLRDRLEVAINQGVTSDMKNLVHEIDLVIEGIGSEIKTKLQKDLT